MQILHQTKMLDAQKSEYLQKHAVFCVIFCNCVYNSKSYFCILRVKFPSKTHLSFASSHIIWDLPTLVVLGPPVLT